MSESTTSGPRGYSSDGTYWTVRTRGGGRYFEVLRLRVGTYERVQTWGTYSSVGAAAGAAATLAYQQGQADTQVSLATKLHEVLATTGLGPIAVPSPELTPEQTADLPADVADGAGDDGSEDVGGSGTA